MMVISSEWGFGQQPGVTTGFARLVNHVWKRAQRYLVSLDPNAKRVIALGSGHLVSINRPGLVTRLTDRVVAAVRSGHRLVPRR
jgi:hypothetical protein